MTKKVASILDGGRNGTGEGIERVLIKADVLGGPHRCIWGKEAPLRLVPALVTSHKTGVKGRTMDGHTDKKYTDGQRTRTHNASCRLLSVAEA